jgi:hypothetical protein
MLSLLLLAFGVMGLLSREGREPIVWAWLLWGVVFGAYAAFGWPVHKGHKIEGTGDKQR